MSETLTRRELGRRLSRLADASVAEVLALAPAAPSKVPRIGLTGAPGVGKSSLAGRLGLLRAQARRIGMLAVDPSSPLTGGAILGDRIRLDELAGAENLYLRSIASRSSSDGLAENLPELLETLAAAGFDELVLETVGVGQAEHAVRSQVDTLALVLMPGSGDTVQAMKAGMMELADLYVINKCELPGAQQLAAEIQRVQSLVGTHGGWAAPVVLTSIHDADTIAELSAAIDAHQAWLADSGNREAVLEQRARYRLRLLLERRLGEVLGTLSPQALDGPLAEQFATVAAALPLDDGTP